MTRAVTNPPPWGWRPEKVEDSSRYTSESPPLPSERCIYWLNRLQGRSWPGPWPDSRVAGAAKQLGIWEWEYTNIIVPATQALKGPNSAEDAEQKIASLAAAARRGRAARRREEIVTAIINHLGNRCADPACILACSGDSGGAE